MIFEVRKGRACDSLAALQFKQILALNTLTLSQGKIVSLQKREITFLDSLVLGRTREIEANRQIWRSERRTLLKANSKLRRWVIGLGVADVALLLILLL